MNRIYLDQASTSFPKAPGVAQAMMDYLTMNGVNVNRGCYSSAYSAEEVIYETRQLLAELFHFSKCKNVIFTPNVTTSLNFILKGILKTRRPYSGIRHGAQCSYETCSTAGFLRDFL